MATLPQTPDIFEQARSLGIVISPSTPTLGAEIAGLDLDRPLTDAEAELLRAAWLRFKVVFFRDQDISHESHVRLGELFGELEGHPVIPHVEGYPEILRIEGVEGVHRFMGRLWRLGADVAAQTGRRPIDPSAGSGEG